MEENNFLKNKNNILFFLIAVLLILVAFFYYQNQKLEMMMKTLMSKQNSPQTEKGSKNIDPYRDGPVKNMIRKNMREIQICYNQFIEKNPSKSDGKVHVDWIIKPNGSVKKVSIIENELNDESLTSCISDKILSWEFPSPPFENEYYAEFKYVFKKSETPPEPTKK